MNTDFIIILLKCFYLMIPAYFANMAPVIVKKIDFLAFPIDFGRKISGKPIFGKNKTFRGFFFGILFSIIAAFIQHLLFGIDSFRGISFYDYSSWLLFGLFMGLGALAGDLAKSLFKRRIGIKPGEKLVPFDQTDFVIGALIFVIPFHAVGFGVFLTCILLSFVLHIIVNHAAFYLKIRNEKW